MTQASYEHPSGTVIHFPFDGSLTAAMRDATTNQYDLFVKSGTPAYSAEGRSGGCLYFDGGTILEVTPFPEFVPTGNAPYTVSLWAKADASCHNHGGWIGYGNSGVNGGSNNFRMNNDTFTSIWNYWWAQDIGATLPSGNFKDGWHHVVGTWDGTTRRLYCDGELRNSDSTYTPNFGNEQFLIGTTLGDANFTGWIDDVLIANRAFTDEEPTSMWREDRAGRSPQTRPSQPEAQYTSTAARGLNRLRSPRACRQATCSAPSPVSSSRPRTVQKRVPYSLGAMRDGLPRNT